MSKKHKDKKSTISKSSDKQIKEKGVQQNKNELSPEKIDFFVKWTQWFLQRRKRKKYVQKVRQKRKNFIEDWGGALIWAACVVLLINQYFFQAYRIPSESMVDTLNKGDMLFVDKMVYGPELIPGYGKLPSVWKPSRGKVIIFESPEYKSKGPAYDLITRLVYMLTFSLVNLDKNEKGEPAVHFLVKRAIGFEGDFISWNHDHLFMDREDSSTMMIEPIGYGKAVRERKLFYSMDINNNTEYRYQGLGDSYWLNTFPRNYRYFTCYPNTPYNGEVAKESGVEFKNRFLAMRDYYGFYVEKDYILPLGDNRNNSHDGRTYGTVHRDKILGRVSIRYWPFYHAGIPD